jgi:hypothetical protein
MLLVLAMQGQPSTGGDISISAGKSVSIFAGGEISLRCGGGSGGRTVLCWGGRRC